MKHNPPPQSLVQLLARAQELSHKTVGEIASILQTPLPSKLTQAKGLIGQCLEAFLGADAGNDSAPDFTKLGVELKTLPLTPNFRPKESTYVCTVPLSQLHTLSWETSVVKAKLNCVLWVPIVVPQTASVSDRLILPPFLWEPSVEEQTILKNDFDEIMDLIALGEIESITASLGTYLHVRPKAAHGASLTSYESHLTLPRGFYLRPSFTAGLVKRLNFV